MIEAPEVDFCRSSIIFTRVLSPSSNAAMSGGILGETEVRAKCASFVTPEKLTAEFSAGWNLGTGNPHINLQDGILFVCLFLFISVCLFLFVGLFLRYTYFLTVLTENSVFPQPDVTVALIAHTLITYQFGCIDTH